MTSQATLEKMITDERVLVVARRLFPGDEHHGDCQNEHGRAGLPCRCCADMNEAWANRLVEVRSAMMEAFR